MPHRLKSSIEDIFGDLEDAALGHLPDEKKDAILLASLRTAQVTTQQLINYDRWREDVSSQLTTLNKGIEALMAAQESQSGAIEGFKEWREEYVAERQAREREEHAQGAAGKPDEDARGLARAIPLIGPVFARFTEHRAPLSLGVGWGVALFLSLAAYWLFIDGGVGEILAALFGNR